MLDLPLLFHLKAIVSTSSAAAVVINHLTFLDGKQISLPVVYALQSCISQGPLFVREINRTNLFGNEMP
ncbi:MAG: hypothetical protein E6L01_00115 [Thaumarchaeota archaeon]|nr:MAG: hypothetical protein E6L01_00115 [Nitrososphaerota archaeon]